MATYHFSNISGNDLNNGLSTGTPKKSLSAVATLSLVAGDSVLFECGSVWNEEVLNVIGQGTSGNQIIYGSYGTGAKPKFSGYRTITSWVNEGNGIYSYQSNDLPAYLRSVKVNDTFQGKGKFPNKGYIPITSNATTTSLTASTLTGAINYAGAEVVSFVLPWVIDRKVISTHSGSTLTFPAMQYTNKTTSGFFIQNHISCLNDLGDWMYDTATKKILMYFGAVNPNTVTVKVAIIQNLITVDRVGGNQNVYKKIEGIELEGANEFGIYLRDTANIEITNMLVQNIGRKGIHTNKDWYNTIWNNYHHNTVINCHEQGIQGDKSCVNAVIDDNVVQNISLDVGLSGLGELENAAINAGNDLNGSSQVTIRNNRVTECGYNGINFHSANCLVEKNYVYGACRRRDDGAGIYTYDATENGAGIIRKNIVIDTGVKDLDYAPNLAQRRPITYGFYCDNQTGNYVIEDNVAAFGQHGGFNFNDTRNITGSRNIGYNNGFNQLSWNTFGGRTPAFDFNFTNNIWYTNLGTQAYLDYLTNSDQSFLLLVNDEFNTFSGYGIMNNNYFFNGNNLSQSVRTHVNYSSYQSRTLAQWNTLSGLEANSVSRPVNELATSRLLYNDSLLPRVYNFTGSAVDQDNVAITSPITLQPFTYKLLLGNVVIDNPAVGSFITKQFKVNLI